MPGLFIALLSVQLFLLTAVTLQGPYFAL
uniref:Uncharacterized protein n=1 Tax=Anguilla anguilla TaxID=7936 RepID=A0A0E9PIT7_ANGAN